MQVLLGKLIEALRPNPFDQLQEPTLNAALALIDSIQPRSEKPRVSMRPIHQRLGDTNVADNDKRWQDMNPDEQAVLIRQISGAVNGLQFRIQDLEEAVKALQERLKKP